ncbi:MAG: BatD family protein [Marinifilaceae bacterium]|nr:BatD family protein [Marinifilaceae bacterium]
MSDNIMKKIVFSLFIILFANIVSNAQVFTANAPRVVELGERFQLVYSLDKRGENLQTGQMSGFNILVGPSVSSSTSTQIINGKISTSSEYSYTFLLVANKTGKFNIPSASIDVDGKTIKSKPLTIEVVKGRQSNSNQNANSGRNSYNENRSRANNSKSTISKKDLFVRVELSRSSVFMGESVVAKLKVYKRRNVPISRFGEYKFPSFDGFLTQEIQGDGRVNFKRETYNGEIYESGTVREMILFPQHKGNIKIDPFELECIVPVRSRGRSIFDDFFDNGREISVSRKSSPLSLRVKDFPANKPSSFDGAVGNFQLRSSINKDTVKANDAITLKVRISGKGNLKLIKALDIDFPADFEVYDPKTNSSLKNTTGGSTGNVSFEYLIIPRVGGDFTIPAVEFSFFNPITKTYVKKYTKEFKIFVEKSKNDNNATVVTSFSKENVKFLGKDIRYLKTKNFEYRSKNKLFFGSVNFYLAYLLPIFILVLIFMINRKRIQTNSDIVKVKNKRANKVAMKRLKKASLKLKANEKDLFYDELLKALWGYTSDKLNLPLSELNKESIAEYLTQRNTSEELISDFIDILDTCEIARYSPMSGSTEMEQLYKTTLNTISLLERTVKR